MSDNNNNLILNPEQVSQKGEEIYKNKLKSVLEPKENGKFVAIEVVSGDYFLGDTILEALEKGRKKYPDRLLHTIKVGYQGVFKMGSYTRKGISYGWNY
ncbi:MAG: hypothetical protein V1732_05805 [Patescibacteria group bacterium]